MQQYFRLLAIYLIVAFSNNLVWFALTFWAYLTTQSVVATGVVGGMFTVVNSLCSFWFGSIVDHHRKKLVMFSSSLISFTFFSLGYLFFRSTASELFVTLSAPYFWILAVILLLGVVVGSLYQIAVPTLVSVLVPEQRRDKANGMLGMTTGIAFALTSVASGLLLAHYGLAAVLLVAMGCSLLALLSLNFLVLPEQQILHVPGYEEAEQAAKKQVDLLGTIRVIGKIPGMFALIFFTTFNNLIGGVFMALMDAYGLTLMSVQQWGTLWGFLSFGFIFGGLAIAKWGLGQNPLQTLFRVNLAIWFACIIFPLQPSIILLTLGSLVWMTLFPFIEATEQTIVQKVVPAQRQGRVFGFAHSVEQAASPLMAFAIGPLAQHYFIPLMTDGYGVTLIGSWFGTGPGRGIALVFIMAGAVGWLITALAKRSKAYHQLSAVFQTK